MTTTVAPTPSAALNEAPTLGRRMLTDGPGIADERLGAVFEPGVSFSATAGHDGAGLGLPLARRLARVAGGDVEALPSSEGARLRVTLPVA